MTRRGEERRADEVGRSVFVVLSVRFTIKTFGEIKISGTMHPRPHTHTHTRSVNAHTTNNSVERKKLRYDATMARKKEPSRTKTRHNRKEDSS